MSEDERSKAEAPASAMMDLGNLPLVEPENGLTQAYSNVVHLNWTLTDVTIRFTELMQETDESQPSWNNQHGILLEHAAITIPWQTAKVLCGNLAALLKNYEKINGELKTPKLPARPE